MFIECLRWDTKLEIVNYIKYFNLYEVIDNDFENSLKD